MASPFLFCVSKCKIRIKTLHHWTKNGITIQKGKYKSYFISQHFLKSSYQLVHIFFILLLRLSCMNSIYTYIYLLRSSKTHKSGHKRAAKKKSGWRNISFQVQWSDSQSSPASGSFSAAALLFYSIFHWRQFYHLFHPYICSWSLAEAATKISQVCCLRMPVFCVLQIASDGPKNLPSFWAGLKVPMPFVTNILTSKLNFENNLLFASYGIKRKKFHFFKSLI